MKRNNMMKYLLIFLPFAFSMASCDVHEFPEIPESREFKINVKYNLESTEFTVWNHLFEDDQVHEVGFDEKYQNLHNQGVVRYIIRAYPKSEIQHSQQYYTKEFVFTRNIADGFNCDFTLDLPPDQYTITVWSDFIRNSGDSYYYKTDGLDGITLQGDYCGNDDYRDAFRGIADVTLPADILEHKPIELDVHMQRPLAKFEFITTDLAEFIDDEYTRVNGKSALQVENTTDKHTETRVNIEDYRVVFYYVGFMPNIYSLLTDKPIDSAMGVLFESRLNSLSEKEASVGFDYVFVNGTESAITVRIAVYDKEGTQLSLTEPIKVPLKRNFHTILRGMFLVSEASGGINIDPDFDGDYNLIFP